MDPLIGEIRLVAFDYAPQGWMLCNGQLLPIAQYQALFALIGNRYGGDARTTFGLPNLGGRVAVGQGIEHLSGTRFVMGTEYGQSTHTLSQNELPFTTTPVAVAAGDSAVSTLVGQKASAPTNNYQPSLVLNYIIAVEGIWPSRP